MMRRLKIVLWVILLAGAVPFLSFPAERAVAFTVSMPRPAARLFHVTMSCEAPKGETQDFLMPAWMPGFYRILDYEKNVSGFRAADGTGRPLPWARPGLAGTNHLLQTR